MKRVVIFVIAVMSVMASYAQKGEKTLGLSAGYNTYNKSAVVGLFFQYRFSRYFRLSPDLQYQIKNNNISGFQFNGNVHVPIAMDTRLNFYPLVGVSYQSWKNDEADKRMNYFGANFGGGFEYFATPTLRLAVEGKYTLIKHCDSGGFVLSVGYLF